WFLGGVGMVGAFVNFEFGHENAAKAVLGNHAADGVGDELFRRASADLFNGAIAFAAFPAGIGHEGLLSFLFAGNDDLFSVNDDNEVAGIHVSGVNRLVFTAQSIGDLYGEASEY